MQNAGFGVLQTEVDVQTESLDVLLSFTSSWCIWIGRSGACKISYRWSPLPFYWKICPASVHSLVFLSKFHRKLKLAEISTKLLLLDHGECLVLDSFCFLFWLVKLIFFFIPELAYNFLLSLGAAIDRRRQV